MHWLKSSLRLVEILRSFFSLNCSKAKALQLLAYLIIFEISAYHVTFILIKIVSIVLAYWTHFEPWFIWISRFSPCFGASCRFGLFHVFDGNLDSDLTKGRARGLLIQAALSWPQFIKSTLTATVQPISLRTFVFFYHFFLCLLRCSLICRVSKCHIKTGIHFEIKRDWLVGFHLCNSLNMAQVEWTDQLLPRLGWGGWWS